MDLLFDAPLWLVGALAAAGVACFVYGNNRRRDDIRYSGLGLLLLGVVLAVVSYLIDTDLEKVTKRTQALVTSVDKQDWKAFQSLLSPNTSFQIYNNREQLVAGAKATAERIGLKSVRVTSLQPKQTQTVITVDLNVISEQDITLGRPYPTSWRFDWQDLGNGWVLTRIENLPNQQIGPAEVNSRLVRP